MEINLTTILNVLNSMGLLGGLSLLSWALIRGDLMSRKVYEEMTKNIMETLTRQIADEIRSVLVEWREERRNSEK